MKLRHIILGVEYHSQHAPIFPITLYLVQSVDNLPLCNNKCAGDVDIPHGIEIKLIH